MEPLSLILALFYCLAMLALLVLIIIEWATHFRQTAPYWKYGVIHAGAVILLGIGMLLSAPKSIEPAGAIVLFIIGSLFASTLVIYTMVGMYSCTMISLPDTPMLRMGFRSWFGRKVLQWEKYIPLALVLAGAGVLYTFMLFWATEPQAALHLEKPIRPDVAAGSFPMTFAVLLGLTCAVGEEVTFRLGIQNYLARRLKLVGSKYVWSIIITSALWTIAHTGSLDPDWVKYAQIFPLGIALGFFYRKYGTEWCIIVHGVFNTIVILLHPYLVFK